MAQFLNKAFQIKPNQLLYQQKRFRAKINLQRPRKTHYTKALVEKFLTPYFERPFKDVPLYERCHLVQKQEQPKLTNSYELVIARGVRNWFDNSRMVAFLHKNSMPQPDVFDLTVALKRENMYLKTYGTQIVRLALEDSPYAAVMPLMQGSYFVIFSPDIRVVQLQKIIKKIPTVWLMAGIMYGRLMDLQDFIKYGTLDLVSARASLVQTLQSAGGSNLNRQLTHHQSTLITRLKQIGTNETPSNKEESDESVPV